MQFKKYRRVSSSLFIFTILLIISPQAFAQRPQPKVKPAAARRMNFAAARGLLTGESEGNLANQPNKFTRTRLSNGQVLELYYPISASSSARKGRTVTAPGYGLLYESEAAFKDATRPRHMLEELIPDGRGFLDKVPQLTARLERRLGGKLDYSRASLRRLDAYIAGFHRSHTTAQNDAQLFQELTAYYGETLRRATGGEWRIREEKTGGTYVQAEPNIALTANGKMKELRPWSSVLTTLYDEDRRGIGLTKVFDADLKAAQ